MKDTAGEKDILAYIQVDMYTCKEIGTHREHRHSYEHIKHMHKSSGIHHQTKTHYHTCQHAFTQIHTQTGAHQGTNTHIHVQMHYWSGAHKGAQKLSHTCALILTCTSMHKGMGTHHVSQ